MASAFICVRSYQMAHNAPLAIVVDKDRFFTLQRANLTICESPQVADPFHISLLLAV